MSHPEDLGEVHWLATLEDPVDLPPGADPDALVHFLRSTASERVGATGARAAWSSAPFPHHAWQLVGSESRSQIWIAQTEDHLHLFVAGPEPLANEFAMWAESLAKAKELLVGGGTPFQWAAIVGPDPDDLLSGPPTFGDLVVGDLAIRPAREALAEWRETQSNLGARQSALTWPVIVEGTTSGYVWSAASRYASQKLRRLAALLSIASSHPWIVRQDPTMSVAGLLDVPDSLPAPEGFGHPAINVDCPQLEAPTWLPIAIDTIESDEDLFNALLAYHEGLLLRRRHPSLAAVAFVAALDGVGRRLATGSRNRFKAAASLVLASDEASSLADAYDLRCSTVHEGALHGDEILGGAFTTPRFLSRDEASEFAWGTLRRLELTAQAVILRLLATGP